MAGPFKYVPHVRLCDNSGSLVVCVSIYAEDGKSLTYYSGSDSVLEIFKIVSGSGSGDHWEYAESTGRPIPDKPVLVVTIVDVDGTLYKFTNSSDKAEPYGQVAT